MKLRTQCNRTGCIEAALFHPVVVFSTANGGIVRVVASFKVCRKCKPRIGVSHVMAPEQIAGIVRDIEKASRVVGRRLAWIRLDSAEARAFQRAIDARAPS